MLLVGLFGNYGPLRVDTQEELLCVACISWRVRIFDVIEWTKWPGDKFFSEYVGFLLLLLFHQYSILMYSVINDTLLVKSLTVDGVVK